TAPLPSRNIPRETAVELGRSAWWFDVGIIHSPRRSAMTEAEVEIENSFYEAIERQDHAEFEQLLDAHPGFRRFDDGRDRWLELAASQGALPIVQLLVRRGANVNQPI